MGVWSRISLRVGAAGVSAAAAIGLIACGGGDASPAPTGAVQDKPPEYVVSADGKRLDGPAGPSTPIEDGVVQGFLDNAVVEEEVVSLIGWAGASDLGGAARKVVAVIDGKSVAVASPSVARPDVADATGSAALANSGFVLRLQRPMLDCSQPEAGITVFAIADGRAAPLPAVGEGTRLSSEAC